MSRGRKTAIGIAILLIALALGNAIVVDGETMRAEKTLPGARLLPLQDGDLQVLERGPRQAPPIVLLHCSTCAIDWWQGMLGPLRRRHRVIAIDLLGHGGSEKPASGYSVNSQARVVAEALGRLGVREATVVGHALGAGVATELARIAPSRVGGIAVVDAPPRHDRRDLGPIARLAYAPIVGEAFWQLKPDSVVRAGLARGFAPGFQVPSRFLEDIDRMTFASYNDSTSALDEYTAERPLDRRLRALALPLLAIVGAREQVIREPARALAAYAALPGARAVLIPSAGHSPNVEAPRRTARLVLSLAARVQDSLQRRPAVRGAP